MRNFNIIRLLILLSIFLLKGCLENPPLVSVKYNINSTSAELLQLLEFKGDYINTSLAPSLITASEIYNSANTIFLDIRTNMEFTNGHIPGAININHSDLLEYLTNNSTFGKKVVIISSSGQAAAYYTSLLRLYGINNVFSLKYGMASWNMDFADIWLKALKNCYLLSTFTNRNFDKGKYSDLPGFDSDKNKTIEGILYDRINLLLKEDFYDDSSAYTQPSVSVEFDSYFDNDQFTNNFFICFGDKYLYYSPGKGEDVPGHPIGTVLYQPYEDLKSINFLQAIPSDKTIFIYCNDGHLSAYVTAYLRTLGYNAHQILFGANSLFYQRMLDPNNPLYRYAFSNSFIMNYQYEKGM